MKKRGQAFLITAVIFIAIVSALITIHNFSKKTEFSTFPYIAEEIQIESEKVMDYDLINSENKIGDFTDDVSNYTKKENIEIYFITGDSGSLICSKCDELTESNNLISAKIGDDIYEFPKTQGKHFYFIMIKEINGEKYVYTNA